MMTNPTAWHLDDGGIDQYVRTGLAPSAMASVEAHLQSCSTCQERLATSNGVSTLAPRLERAWLEAADRIDRPRQTWVEGAARLVRVPDHLARLLGASATFRGAWSALLALVLVAAVGIGRGDLAPVPFLLLAPLVPVLGVAAAYAGWDPTGSARALEVATPFGELRLLLLRTTAVTAASVVALGVASLLLPGLGPGAVSWLLPALALTAATLALSTRFSAEASAGLVAAGWLLLLGLLALELPPDVRPTSTDLGALATPLQLAAGAVLVASSAAFLVRRERIDLPTR